MLLLWVQWQNGMGYYFEDKTPIEHYSGFTGISGCLTLGGLSVMAPQP
jgi:hypothetical protein